MFEIATKAYHFDAALTFGRQGYLATGRDFVIRHLSFPETFRATAHSHLYLGAEMVRRAACGARRARALVWALSLPAHPARASRRRSSSCC